MRLETARADTVRSVAFRMREWDEREIYAGLFEDDPEELVDRVMAVAAHGPVAQVALIGADPVCVFGAGFLSPVAVQVFAFATNRFGEIALPLTRYLKHRLFPAMAASGITRGECRALCDHTEAIRWLKILGAQEEAVCPHLGKNGETYVQLAWSPSNVFFNPQTPARHSPADGC